jgi:predicted RNase H-like HicB family nuclease
MKDKTSMIAVRLHLELNEETGVYTVTSPDVPGLVTEGSTPVEIQTNVAEVLQGLMGVRSIIRELGISREDFGQIK